jgi:hypothetical protein
MEVQMNRMKKLAGLLNETTLNEYNTVNTSKLESKIKRIKSQGAGDSVAKTKEALLGIASSVSAIRTNLEDMNDILPRELSSMTGPGFQAGEFAREKHKIYQQARRQTYLNLQKIVDDLTAFIESNY